MAPPLPLSAIPTISDLYKNGTLQPHKVEEEDDPLPQPSAALNSKVSLIRTSITTLAATSIVNAANESLLGGGGVDGAIHSAAGPSLLEECRTLDGCSTGSAKMTTAHALPSKFIIHAVGPIYYRAKRSSESRPAELLASCYETSLKLAKAKGGSVAFSCLSTGVYGYPSGEAAEVACGVVREFLEKEGGLERVVFCCFEGKDERAYGEWLPKIFPQTPGELPSTERSTESTAAKDQTSSKTSSGASTSAPTPKKAQEDIDKDWEAVEKPGETTSEKATDISDEGEKVEAPDLGADDGEKVEKPVVKEPVDELAESGEVLPKSGLLKDW